MYPVISWTESAARTSQLPPPVYSFRWFLPSTGYRMRSTSDKEFANFTRQHLFSSPSRHRSFTPWQIAAARSTDVARWLKPAAGSRRVLQGEKREATKSTADWKLMWMRERTRSNCGRRYPSMSVAKVEGGDHARDWGSLGGTGDCDCYAASTCTPRRAVARRLPRSPLRSLRYWPNRFKIAKATDPGGAVLLKPLSVSMRDIRLELDKLNLKWNYEITVSNYAGCSTWFVTRTISHICALFKKRFL